MAHNRRCRNINIKFMIKEFTVTKQLNIIVITIALVLIKVKAAIHLTKALSLLTLNAHCLTNIYSLA